MNKTTFYFLSFAWGLPMTLIGCIVSAILIVAGKRPLRNHYGWVFILGTGWGGISFGPVSIVASKPSEHILAHEFGHSIQNCYFGPLMIIISIASVIRYWYREIAQKLNLIIPSYDAIWFEGQATRWGKLYKNN